MPSSLVLIPPLVVLTLSLVTKRIIESLFAGICVAAYIASNYSFIASIELVAKKFLHQCGLPGLFTGAHCLENIYLFGFLILLGIFISLLTHTGGTAAYGRLINKNFRTNRTVETSSLVLSLFCVIDDYFSILTVGSVMQRMVASCKIPRVKLAFLINSMGPTLSLLCPITSWTAMLLAQFSQAGISTNIVDKTTIIGDPFTIYLNIIPYVFYSFIIFCSTWFIVRRRISYGPMHHHEHIAASTGNLFGGKEPLKNALTSRVEKGTLADFLFPISFLMLSVIVNILRSGHYFGSSISIAQALSQANIFYALCVGTLYALAVSIAWFLITRKCSFKELFNVVHTGFMLMFQSIIVLLLANVFSDFIKNDLHTGEYVSQYLGSIISIPYVPFILFITSLIIAAGTGSSWGSIAIMIPISIPILISLTGVSLPVDISTFTIFFPALGAILSGSVAGTHISPLADNMVMASLSSGSYHNDHVRTQVWYVLPAIISCALSFLLVGFLTPIHAGLALFCSIIVGVLCVCGSLSLLHYIYQKRHTPKLSQRHQPS